LRFRLALVFALAATAPAADPMRYGLDTGASEVAFEVDMGRSPIRGRMPVTKADLILDFDRAAGSRVRVTLDAAGARMSFPFATQAMQGPSGLNTALHPAIRFESTRVTAEGQGARIDGRLTVRGITRPVILQARIYRPKGTAPGDRRQLSIRLTGRLSRAAFGATGFSDLVGDEVRLDILARIRLAP
jgi:polyisoprenoid-binding protein YceI